MFAVTVALLLLAVAQITESFKGASTTLRLSISMGVSSPSVDVLAKGMDLTDGMRERVTAKIGRVMDKLGFDAISANVVLRTISSDVTAGQSSKKNSQIAEVTVAYKHGSVLHASESTDDLYASIDLISHKLARSMKKHNSKIKDNQRKSGSISSSEAELADSTVADTFDEEELLVDLDIKYAALTKPPINFAEESLSVLRPKKFAMPPISVDDALAALELIDHPFYVFRNKGTNEINVIYHRTHGGVGLIMPDEEE